HRVQRDARSCSHGGGWYVHAQSRTRYFGNRLAVRQLDVAGGIGGDHVTLGQAGVDFHIIEIDETDADIGAHQLAILDAKDIRLSAAVELQCPARHGEYMRMLLQRDLQVDVCVRHQRAVGVVYVNHGLADETVEVGDDCSGDPRNVAVPFPGLRLPCDFDRLPDGQNTDIRFVEVGRNPHMLQVRHADEL